MLDRNRVDAIAKSGRLRAIIKDVSEMTDAAIAVELGADLLGYASVHLFANVFLYDRLIK